MQEAKALPTPMVSSLKLSALDGSLCSNPKLYRSIVGGLQYATLTHPEIAFSVNKTCQFMHNPSDTHWEAVKRILRYLQGAASYGLKISKNSALALTGYSDADWTSSVDDKKFTSGFCVYLGKNLISCYAKKQQTISKSSAEAEYKSLSAATANVLWIQFVLKELKVPLSKPPLFVV